MAKRLAGGSTKNGRDSAGRRLGLKVNIGSFIKAGTIICRQRGTKFFTPMPNRHVGQGRDHTIFAKASGWIRRIPGTKLLYID